MVATHFHEGQGKICQGFPNLHLAKATSTAGSSKQIVSRGELYARALAIEHEAEARYREFATFMADYGKDAIAELFGRLAEFEAEHALQVAKKSVGVEIPVIDPCDYAWLDNGAPVPEARAFIFRMMTPRLALEIALRAEQRAKQFFERVCAESRDARVQELAAEFARDEESHIDWVTDALAQLPGSFRPYDQALGDPPIEHPV